MECVVLAVACLITYWPVTSALYRVYSLSRDDDLLGGMWAVLTTIFVLRDSFGKSVTAAVRRMAATFVSFVLCLAYLAFLPFHPWALWRCWSAPAPSRSCCLAGSATAKITAGITTAVILVVAAISPQHAWQQPILRLADTVSRRRHRGGSRLDQHMGQKALVCFRLFHLPALQERRDEPGRSRRRRDLDLRRKSTWR